MERKVPFIENEIYHLYTRGVEKRPVFMGISDHERFLALLAFSNEKHSGVRFSNLPRNQQGFPLLKLPAERESVVDIAAYALMHNHIHLLVREKVSGGISKFMLKLMTAYSMYFNTKYDRSGPLFTRPFRSRHVDSEEYFRWLFAYVTLNPLELHQPDWKRSGIQDASRAAHFMQSYRYSSFPDYFGAPRVESCIIRKDALPFDAGSIGTFDTLLRALSEHSGTYEAHVAL